MKAQVYKANGTKSGQIDLPESLFGVRWNPDLVHQVVVSMESNARANTAHVKDRSEVSGTNQKPWRQKGTGRSRHGQEISPIWTGGGIAHGPRNTRNYKKKINKKMRRKALASVLSKKHADGEVLFVESLDLNEPKTAAAHGLLSSLATVEGFGRLASKRRRAAIIASPERAEAAQKSLRNIGSVAFAEVRNLNPVDLLRFTYLVVEHPKEAIETLARGKEQEETEVKSPAPKKRAAPKKTASAKKPAKAVAKKPAPTTA